MYSIYSDISAFVCHLQGVYTSVFKTLWMRDCNVNEGAAHVCLFQKCICTPVNNRIRYKSLWCTCNFQWYCSSSSSMASYYSSPFTSLHQLPCTHNKTILSCLHLQFHYRLSLTVSQCTDSDICNSQATLTLTVDHTSRYLACLIHHWLTPCVLLLSHLIADLWVHLFK
jgi:hypothetical protein